jgi:4'-phosphopantetheinyl transferase
VSAIAVVQDGAGKAFLDVGEAHVWRLPRTSSGSRVVISSVLAGYLGVDECRVRVGHDEEGKPRLVSPEGCGLELSISHGGSVSLLAVTRAARVGVDVEPLRLAAAGWAVVREALTPAEWRALPAEREARAGAFLRVWSRKEALLKAIGVGLAIEPRLVELSRTQIVALPPAFGSREAWTLADLALPGHVAALAVEGLEPAVRSFVWDST